MMEDAWASCIACGLSDLLMAGLLADLSEWILNDLFSFFSYLLVCIELPAAWASSSGLAVTLEG